MAVGEWIRIAATTEIGPGQALWIEIEDEPIAVWNVNGEFYATQDTCTHEEASLSEGDLWGDVVECPLHGAQFDVRTGAVLSLPAVFPLRTFPVREQDGALYIEWKGA